MSTMTKQRNDEVTKKSDAVMTPFSFLLAGIIRNSINDTHILLE